MSKITGIVIAKNSEELIADCLDSLAFCDEKIVIDNDSQDRTVEVAKMMDAKVYPSKSKNFSELRNLGMQKARTKWIIYVDSDERVSKELAEEIKEIISQKEDDFSGYEFRRKNFYFGNVEWPKYENILRFFKKESLKGWAGELHESPVVEGKIGKIDEYLIHYTHRDLTSMLSKTIEWSETEARLRVNANHPRMSWWRFPRVMLSAFIDSYIKQKGYKAGTAGLVESIYQSFSMFITYARLWEIQNGANKIIKKDNV